MKFHQPPHQFVGSVSLKVQDLQRSIQFYQEIIGFKVLEQTERKAQLTADGKRVLLTIEQPHDVEPRNARTTGLYHFALLLPERSDLAAIVRHFVNHGIRFGSSDHLVSEALYLSDPDGNGIEIYADRDPSVWNWNDQEVDMATIMLDFQDLLADERGNYSWTGLPEGTVMGHIHLQASELQQMEKFYTKGLGFEVVNRYGGQALFTSDGKYHHHIAFNTWAGVGIPAPSSNSAGLKSYSIVFPTESARDQAIAQLNGIGATVKNEENTWITFDPSQNEIHLEVFAV